ncbi:MAG: hypothetical protein AAF844_00630 [Pseudomonadota bacterium]
MKRMLFATLALMPLIASPVSAADEKPSIVTVLTAPEPQTQLMAMVLSMQSIQQGAAVRVLLCGPAGDLALKDAPPSATAAQKPKGMSPQGLMQKIIATGAPVEVCAIYLPNKGVGLEALIEGVAAARPPEMADHLLADDTRLLTF